jgi:hypothetical protein
VFRALYLNGALIKPDRQGGDHPPNQRGERGGELFRPKGDIFHYGVGRGIFEAVTGRVLRDRKPDSCPCPKEGGGVNG